MHVLFPQGANHTCAAFKSKDKTRAVFRRRKPCLSCFHKRVLARLLCIVYLLLVICYLSSCLLVIIFNAEFESDLKHKPI